MKRFRCNFVSFLLGIAIYVSVLPRVDLPETVFDESDATLSVVLPAQCRVQVSTRVSAISAAAVLDCGSCVVHRLAFGRAVIPDPRDQNHLRVFLCTFLI